MNPDEAVRLFDRLSKTAHEGCDDEWLHFIVEVLNLPECYLPAAQEILRQGAWRRHTGQGQNPIGYVKTATKRQGLRMGLATHRYNPTEPWVPTKDQPPKRELENRMEELRFDHADKRRGHVPLTLPREVSFTDHVDGLDFASQGMLTKTKGGAWHQGSGEEAEYDCERHVPEWLQLNGEPDTVDWDTVAKYAALKPDLAPSIAKALRLRLEARIGRPAAMRAASSPREARQIEAAWKWIDRYAATRIAPLFRLSAPPVPQEKTKGRGELIRPAQGPMPSVRVANLLLRPKRSS